MCKVELRLHILLHFSQRCNIEMGSGTLIEAKADEAQRDASRDLFLWAVVHKNKQLAEIAWEQVSEARAVCPWARACVRAWARVFK